MERGSRLRALHSISGVVPVGAFLVFHLSVNASAGRGADAYNAAAQRLQGLPLLVWAEVIGIVVPLAFHGIVGLFLIASVPAAADHPTASGRRMAILQRITGVILFPFILFHLWTTRLVQMSDHGSLDLFHLMQSALASPWIRAFYVAGTLAATSHLASGLWSVSRTLGLGERPRARRVLAAVAAGIFVVLSAIGLRAVAAFRLP